MNFWEKTDWTIVLVFCLLSLILVAVWFRNGNLFLGAEEGVPFYNLSYTLNNYASTWLEEYLGLAYLVDIVKIPYFSILVFLNLLGINSFFLQVGTFFIILFGGSISSYYLFKIFFKKLFYSRVTAFLGAMFYLLNPYSISDVWSRGIYNQFFAYLYYPFFLLMFVLYLEKKKHFYLIVGLFFSFIFSSCMGNPSYAISLWVLMGIFSFFFLLNHRSDRKFLYRLIGGGITYFLGWLVINCWWLVILIGYAPGAFLVKGSGFQNALETLQAISQQTVFTNTFRLFHAIRFENDFYGTVYQNKGLVFLSWLLPVVIIFAIRFFKTCYFKFLAGLFALGLFVCVGSSFPFGKLFVFLFTHISVLQVFRNPYEKFGLVFLLAYSGLFGLGFTSIYILLKKYLAQTSLILVAVLVFFLNGVLVWPMWTGDVIGWGTQSEIPDRYTQYDLWLKGHNSGGNLTFFLPFLPSLGASYHWGGDYHGSDPIYQMITSPVITQTGTNPILTALKSSIGKQDVSGALALLNVRFMVDRPDIVADTQERTALNRILSKQSDSNFIQVASISGMPVFELKQPKPVSTVGSLSQLEKVKTYSDLFDRVNKVDLQKNGFVLDQQNVSDPPLDTSFNNQIVFTQKYNEMRFFVRFNNQSQKLLFLSKTYDPQWNIIPVESEALLNNTFLNNLKLLFSRDAASTHFIINGYANGWVINDQNQEFLLMYKPQLVMEILWIISLSVFLILSIILCIIILRSLMNKKGFKPVV